MSSGELFAIVERLLERELTPDEREFLLIAKNGAERRNNAVAPTAARPDIVLATRPASSVTEHLRGAPHQQSE